jgi:hypothetical protein
MQLVRWLGTGLLLVAPTLGLTACGDDDDDDDDSKAAECHCEWGDTCDEYSSGCAFLDCESNGQNVKAEGACPQEDVIGVCTCASENLVTYYRSGVADPAQECSFWCDDGMYTPR